MTVQATAQLAGKNQFSQSQDVKPDRILDIVMLQDFRPRTTFAPNSRRKAPERPANFRE
jgi:hypothetical protein